MKKKLILGMTVLFMIIAVIFIACPSDSGGGSADSDDGDEVETTDPNAPIINTDGKEGEAIIQDTDLVLTVTVPNVEDESLLRYQWYWNEVNSNQNGHIILGADKKDYTPPTDVPGILYYYVEVIFPDPDMPHLFSKPIKVEVLPKEEGKIYAQRPQITAQPESKAYLAGTSPDEVEELTLTAILPQPSLASAGTLACQWYKNSEPDKETAEPIGDIVESTNGTIISICKPDISEEGTIYYFAEITNTIPEGENVVEAVGTRSSGFAIISVIVNALPPVITVKPESKLYGTKADFETAVTQNKAALSVTASSPDGEPPHTSGI